MLRNHNVEQGSESSDKGYWARLATLGGLAAVLDPKDTAGTKNRLIDRLHKHALARAIGDVDGRRVLDFGCGNGRISSWLARQGAIVHGLDTSPEMVELARKAVPGARFDVVDADTLPVDNSSYDLVVSVGVLLYLAPDQRRLTQIVRELERAMTPEGGLVVLEQVQDGSLPRGAPLPVYEAAFSDAGLTVVSTAPVRRSDSRLFGLLGRRRGLSRLPWVPALLRRGARKSPRPDAYAEYVMVVERD
jgi:SAM-dependent methyltransferase